MCLPLGQKALLLPPNERAVWYGALFRYIVLFQYVLALLNFVAFQWVAGIIDIAFASVGSLSVYHKDNYNVQQIICYTVFGMVRAVWSALALIAFAADVSQVSLNKNQEIVYWIVITAGTAFYIVSSAITYTIYNELRIVAITYIPPADQGYHGPAAFPAPGDASYGSKVDAKGFKPFSGTGHRLGEGP